MRFKRDYNLELRKCLSNINKDFTLLTNYKNRRTPIYIQSYVGIHKLYPGSLLDKNNSIDVRSILDKKEYYQNIFNCTKSLRDLTILENVDNIRKPVLIKSKYGLVKTRINDLLNGFYPCIKTAIDKTSFFITMAKDKYPQFKYDFVKYKNSNSNIIVVCKYHGKFKIKPINITNNFICPKCIVKSYNKSYANKYLNTIRNRKCCVYIIKCYDFNENFYKIGITEDIQKRIKAFPYTVKILKLIVSDYYNSIFLENNLHNYHGKYSYLPKKNFSGKTECFSKILLKI